MNRLEAILESLPEAIDWPEPSAHLAESVTARIEPRPSSGQRRFRPLALVAALSLIVVVLAVFPATRRAVADIFQEAGVRIGIIDGTSELAEDLDLPEEISLEEAVGDADFDVRVPARLGPPDSAHRALDGGIVMLWNEGPVILSQRVGGDTYAEKGVSPETNVSPEPVGDGIGLWIQGAPHVFTLVDEEGEVIEETSRLASNVLLWSADGLDYRLEIDGDFDTARAIAESLSEVDG